MNCQICGEELEERTAKQLMKFVENSDTMTITELTEAIELLDTVARYNCVCYVTKKKSKYAHKECYKAKYEATTEVEAKKEKKKKVEIPINEEKRECESCRSCRPFNTEPCTCHLL